jgi:hypothetical protein
MAKKSAAEKWDTQHSRRAPIILPQIFLPFVFRILNSPRVATLADAFTLR